MLPDFYDKNAIKMEFCECVCMCGGTEKKHCPNLCQPTENGSGVEQQ